MLEIVKNHQTISDLLVRISPAIFRDRCVQISYDTNETIVFYREQPIVVEDHNSHWMLMSKTGIPSDLVSDMSRSTRYEIHFIEADELATVAAIIQQQQALRLAVLSMEAAAAFSPSFAQNAERRIRELDEELVHLLAH